MAAGKGAPDAELMDVAGFVGRRVWPEDRVEPLEDHAGGNFGIALEENDGRGID